ncbi:MAG: preprotein translocase subunit SecE [Eubacteriales bacterium]|nr:preprotein translocase subunit SecE [Eubacteriales bacterium]
MAAEVKTGKSAKDKRSKKIFRFFKEVRSELKKVVWPNRKQLLNSTVSVLLACLLVGALIWISDWLLLLIVSNTLTG